MASSGAVQISHAKGPSASCVTLEAGRPKIIALDAITRQTRVLCRDSLRRPSDDSRRIHGVVWRRADRLRHTAVTQKQS